MNITAVVSLDLALQGLLVQLNLCISGILIIIAPLYVSHSISSACPNRSLSYHSVVKLTAVVNLALPLVLAVLAL